MEKQFTVKLTADQMRVLSSYLSEAEGNEMPTLMDYQKEIQDIVSRALEAYGDAIGDYITSSGGSLLTLQKAKSNG